MVKTTAERLKEIMTEQDLKQSDIIERAKPFMEQYGAKLTRPDLSQYCSGKVKPSQEKMFLLAAALNVSEAWLMGYDVPRTRTRETTEAAYLQPMVSFLKSDNEIAEIFVKNKIKEAINVTNDEYELIIAFRKANPDRQDSVRCLLGIETKRKNENVG